mmetsp:Transcript_75936/g.220510  ORF Transcript_75936/g.220510 Transcript_75936/m.220510 type:complete len:401 (+) Transcript_75936:158-1360(+)
MSADVPPATYSAGYQTFGGGVSFRPAAARPATSPVAPVQQVHASPGFPGAVYSGGGGTPLGDKAFPERTLWTPRNILLVVGAVTLQLAIVPPIWDASLLLDDPAFAFFVGRPIPAWTIGACLLAVLLYSAAVVGFFRFSREESKTNQNVLRITAAILTALGLVFLALSQPLTRDSTRAYEEVLSNCRDGARSESLALQYASLQKLRSQHGCLEMESIEKCEGFASSPLSRVLKDFERNYHCSGFCAPRVVAVPGSAAWQAAIAAGGNAAHESPIPGVAPEDIKAAIEIDASAATASGPAGGPPPSVVEALQRYVEDQARNSPTAASMTQVYELRPALFSKTTSMISCDGGAGRALKYRAARAGEMLYWEGVLLLIIAVVGTILQIGVAPQAQAKEGTSLL